MAAPPGVSGLGTTRHGSSNLPLPMEETMTKIFKDTMQMLRRRARRQAWKRMLNEMKVQYAGEWK